MCICPSSFGKFYLKGTMLVMSLVLTSPADAKCVSLPDNKSDGLAIVRPDSTNVLVPFRENVTLTCSNTGRILRKTATSGFRQCVYDPKPVSKT
jgi:hypothetical protein